MKRVTLFVLLALLGPHTALAEEPEAVAVTASLVTPFFGAYELEAITRVSNSFGVLVNTSYLTLDNGAWTTRTGTVGAGLNYYFLGSALRRWYVELIGELLISSWRHQPSREVAPIVLGATGLAIVGYKFVWDVGAVIDVGAGAVAMHFPSARVELDNGAVSSRPFTRLYPAVKLNVGWAF